MAFTFEQREEKGETYAEVTGYDGHTKILRIPETLGGLPVRSIGSNAFSWRNDITEAILPERLETLRGFAFYNSSALRRIALYDGIEDYYDGVIRHCRKLSDIHVTMERGNYALLRALLADNDRCLRLSLIIKGEQVCLTFPAYFSDYIEDTRARAFHTKIEGAGYIYRECVTGREIRFQEYDDIFIRASSDDADMAAQIAIDRLMYPHALSAAAGRRYRDYLTEQMPAVLPQLIADSRTDLIDGLAKMELIPQEACEAGIRLASRQGAVQVCARLMEVQQKSRRPAGRMTL